MKLTGSGSRYCREDSTMFEDSDVRTVLSPGLRPSEEKSLYWREAVDESVSGKIGSLEEKKKKRERERDREIERERERE